MKKFLLKAFMLLCLIAWGGVSSAWAADVTWTSSEAGYENGAEVSNVTINSNISLTFDKGTNSNAPKYYTTGTAVRAYGGNTIAVNATNATITGITFTFGSSDGSNDITANVGNFSSPSWSGSANAVTFTIGGTSGNRRISAIKVTYSTSDGSGDNGDSGGDEPGGDTPTPSAVGTYLYVETPLANITSSDEVVMVWTNNSGSYGITSGNGASSAPTAVAVEIEDGMFVTDNADIVWNVDYSDGKLTIYPNGTTEKWLYCTANNNGVRVGTNSNKTFVIDANYLQHEATSRYLGIYNNSDIRCYTTINTNIENQTLAFYVKKGVQTTISAASYSTFFDSEHAYVMPDDCAGYVFTAANGLELAYDAKKVVPAGEPLVLYTIEPGTKTLVFTTSSDETIKSGGMNDLDGTDAETELTPDDSYYFYGLSLNASSELSSVGFYWMAAGGAAFTNGAHKAYLKLPKSMFAEARSGFAFNEDTEALESIEMSAATTIYTLNGVKVNELQKGLNIVNGKKVMVK